MNDLKYKNDTLDLGEKVIIGRVSYFLCQSPEWIKVLVDSHKRIIAGVRQDGSVYINKIAGLEEQVEKIVNTLFTNKSTLDKFSENNGRLLWEDKPIENDSITQAEADVRYATKDTENAVSSQSTQISALNNTVSALVESAIPLSNVNKIINAADFGFDPENNASDNVAALNRALYGGNKTIVISKTGVYSINDTILLYDNTELICGKGVFIKKDANYFNMFRNIGAGSRIYNENITICGLHLIINGKTGGTFDYSSPVYGLRGELAFLCAKNIKIEDFYVYDLDQNSYGIMLNQCENIVIDGFIIKGQKDAVHISATNQFVIKNGVTQTYDDSIALNAADWETSNCVQGDITNGIIENVTDEALTPTSGYCVRLLVGAWVDWYEGIPIRRGEHVVNNGRLYKAIGISSTLDEGNVRTYYSQTEPTISVFDSYQQDAAGFKWKLVRDDRVYYSSNIKNVKVEHYNGYSQRSGIACETYIDSQWARTIHPDVAIEDYPKINNIEIKNSGFKGDLVSNAKCCNYRLMFENIIDAKSIILRNSQNHQLEGYLMFNNVDLSDAEGDYQLYIPSGVQVVIDNSKQKNVLTSYIQGRVTGDIDVSTLPPEAKDGDIIRHNGTLKVHNGSNWVNMF